LTLVVAGIGEGLAHRLVVLETMGAYEQAVRNLYRVNAFVPNKMGLDNIRGLHRYLGSPMDGVPCVHIAGTNGKVGSLFYYS
jgi:folylpolyglutamate synthase/dihydropteroate synthase